MKVGEVGMKAVVELDVPEWQIGQDVSVYFPDTMLEHGKCKLLKEQEAVKPKTEPSAKGFWYSCGACGWWLFQVCDTVHFDDRKRIHFCASCGRPVKWE